MQQRRRRTNVNLHGDRRRRFGGVAVEDNSFTIGNTAPEVTGVTPAPQPLPPLTPSPARTANDVDGDPLTHSYTWTNLSTGVAVGYAETLTLTPLQVAWRQLRLHLCIE